MLKWARLWRQGESRTKAGRRAGPLAAPARRPHAARGAPRFSIWRCASPWSEKAPANFAMAPFSIAAFLAAVSPCTRPRCLSRDLYRWIWRQRQSLLTLICLTTNRISYNSVLDRPWRGLDQVPDYEHAHHSTSNVLLYWAAWSLE